MAGFTLYFPPLVWNGIFSLNSLPVQSEYYHVVYHDIDNIWHCFFAILSPFLGNVYHNFSLSSLKWFKFSVKSHTSSKNIIFNRLDHIMAIFYNLWYILSFSKPNSSKSYQMFFMSKKNISWYCQSSSQGQRLLSKTDLGTGTALHHTGTREV